MIERLWHLISENFGTKVVSVIFAVVLWVIVLGSRNVEVTKEVPIEIVTPADIVPANDVPDRVAFRLSGPKAFLRAVLDRREEPIRVNLSSAKPGLVTYRLFSDNIRVPIGVKVLSINPTAILIKLEYLKRRDVPVRVETHGNVPEGYKVSRMEIHPEVVRIRGAESRVDATTEVVTSPIDLSTLKESIDREVPLELARNNISLDGALPRVVIGIEPLSANYRVKNIDIRALSSYKSRVEPKTVSILVRTEEQNLKYLDKAHVLATIDMKGKPKGQYENQPIKVSVPDHVGVVRVVPDRASVTLY